MQQQFNDFMIANDITRAQYNKSFDNNTSFDNNKSFDNNVNLRDTFKINDTQQDKDINMDMFNKLIPQNTQKEAPKSHQESQFIQSTNKNYQKPKDFSSDWLLNSQKVDRLKHVSSSNDINALANDKHKISSMSTEIIEKDKQIQSYKNDIEILESELALFKEDKSNRESEEMEIKILQEKLNEQYSENNKLEGLKIENKKLKEDCHQFQITIQTLKEIIQKAKSNNQSGIS